jgi:sec-independent protein translocase protein TatB
MMPGIGFTEMILLVIVSMVVIGPKDLPLMMRKFGKFTGQMRALAFEFRQGIDELGRQAELEELRKEVATLKEATGVEELQRDLQQDQIAFQQEVTSSYDHQLPSPEETAVHEAQVAAEIQPAAMAEIEENHFTAGVAYEAEVYDVPEPEPATAKSPVKQDASA